MYHISDIKKYNNCHKLFYLDKNNHGSFFNYLKNDYSLTDLIIKLFNLENPFIGSVGDSFDKALNCIGEHSSFINSRFEYNGVRIKAFLLIKNDDGYILYFFHPFLQKDLDIDNYYIVYDVLAHNGINVTSILDIYVNNQYILKDELEVEKIFNTTDEYLGNKIIDLVKKHSYDYLNVINEMNNLSSNIINNYAINKNCLMCNHLDDCFPNGFPNDSILHLVSSKDKFEMYNDGLKNLRDVDVSRLEGTSLQYAQIMASRNNGKFVDKNLLSKFLKSSIKYPISFIDFEWDTYLIPTYKNMKCFGCLPFEFCLYVLEENGNIVNKTFLGLNDCREEFIQNIIDALPKEGTIVAYNSFSAEVLRIKELIEQFPKYKDDLLSISKRFIDLAEPFSKGFLYDNRFAGKLSVKSLVSVIASIDYSKLNIKDGLDAVYNYRKYLDKNDENIKNNLIEYCNLDAYSLLIIYNYLIDLVKE